jgi:cell wall-associated NlpC family hydrolase
MKKADYFINYLLMFVGQPYEWGGDGRKGKGFDCSGLILEGLMSVGAIDGRDRTAQMIYDHFKKTAGATSATLPGTLVFFGKNRESITHVGAAINEFQFIEAGGGDSKNISGMVRMRPLSFRSDLVASLYIF